MSAPELPPFGPPLVPWLGRRLDGVEGALLQVSGQIAAQRPQLSVVAGGGNTDATGAVDITVLVVPDGLRLTLHRLVMEAVNQSTGLPYTPASPYTSATAWVGLYRSGVSLGSRIDFAPAGGGGALFPSNFGWGGDAPVLAGGEILLVHVVGGPASTAVAVSAQGWLS